MAFGQVGQVIHFGPVGQVGQVRHCGLVGQARHFGQVGLIKNSGLVGQVGQARHFGPVGQVGQVRHFRPVGQVGQARHFGLVGQVVSLVPAHLMLFALARLSFFAPARPVQWHRPVSGFMHPPISGHCYQNGKSQISSVNSNSPPVPGR